jgi:uncharacterized surface protein with fasciclin (FAS1) repeats
MKTTASNARYFSLRFLSFTLLFVFILQACSKKEETALQPSNDELFLQQKANEFQTAEINAANNLAKQLGFTNGDVKVAGRTAQQTVYQLVAGNPHFSTLTAAIAKTGLTETLNDVTAEFTVFAPVNSAFAKLPFPFNNAASINAISNPGQLEFLKNVILYHAIGAKIVTSQIPVGRINCGTLKPWGENPDNIIYFSNNFGLIKINGKSSVICSNLNAGNGVVHVVSEVLLFPTQTIAQMATGNPSLTSLVAALDKTNLTSVFTGSGDFTVFAPTNSAFAKLPAPFNNAANISAIADQGQIDALTNILLYHVTDSRYFGWDLGIFSKITMLSAGPKNKVTGIIGWPTGWVKGNRNRFFSYIRPGDVFATNGVVHVIGDVLQP